jgi:hypothetical protein
MVATKGRIGEMGRKARSKVVAKYSMKQHIQNICTVYKSLL